MILPFALLILSLLMVSNLRLPKAKAPTNPVLKWTMILIVTSVYICGLTWTAPEYLLGVVVTFIVGGILYGIIYLPKASFFDEEAIEESPAASS